MNVLESWLGSKKFIYAVTLEGILDECVQTLFRLQKRMSFKALRSKAIPCMCSESLLTYQKCIHEERLKFETILEHNFSIVIASKRRGVLLVPAFPVLPSIINILLSL
ncbi:hypothetical protein Dimus_006736 [Dionaea muscipula]